MEKQINPSTKAHLIRGAFYTVLLVAATLLSFFRAQAPAKLSQRTISFEERVAYQRAIEQVYWRHRIWPKESSKYKPSLDEVMPQAQLEKKVTDYLRKSKALQDYWQRPITAEQLQVEMDRMAQNTRQSEVLRELFEALGNDPFVIAECLARPALAQSLFKSSTDFQDASQVVTQAVRFVRTNRTAFRGYTLPVITRTSKGQGLCNDDWGATSTVGAPSAREGHTAVWTGSEMIVWGGTNYSTNFNTGGRYNPTTDSWTATSTANAPTARESHTAVWTGSEMIIWGGYPYSTTGGRYNPSTDSWTATSTTNAPTARESHTAVWTGSEMIVWGGRNNNTVTNTGGRYNPSTDSWAATSTTNAPAGRSDHSAVWTGSEMIVWAGYDGTNTVNTGGRYNPSTDSWTASSITNAPSARVNHTAVWTGNEMIVWGGVTSGPTLFNTGGRYNPGTDSWTATSTANAPNARVGHTAVWTGSEMIVWGGIDNVTYSNTGGRYNPGMDSWTTTGVANAPSARWHHSAVWTDTEMIVWGGEGLFNTGGRYCGQYPTPTPTATATATATPTASPTITPVECELFENFDFVTPPALPGGWTATNGINGDGIFWQTSNSGLPSPPVDSPPNAAWVNDPAAISDKYLDSPPVRIALPLNAFLLFRSNYSLEDSRDGGVMEVSIDGGPFQDILAAGGQFFYGGYNGTISSCCGNPLAGRQAWTGSSGGFITTSVDMHFARGHTSVLRWRMGSDSSTSGQGWRIDTVEMTCYNPTPTATATPTPTATASPTPIGCALSETFDNVNPPGLPAGWIATNGINPDAILWQTSNSGQPTPSADSLPNAARVNDPAAISDKYLDSPPIRIEQLKDATLMFRNNYALETSFDGGVLEVSIDGGAFQDIIAAGGSFLQGGYNDTISNCCGNPLAGRQAWTGSSGGFITTAIDMAVFQGHSIVLRWRMGSDSDFAGQGWRIDSVQVGCERLTPTPTATVTATATATLTPRPTPTPRLRPTPAPRS